MGHCLSCDGVDSCVVVVLVSSGSLVVLDPGQLHGVGVLFLWYWLRVICMFFSLSICWACL